MTPDLLGEDAAAAGLFRITRFDHTNTRMFSPDGRQPIHTGHVTATLSARAGSLVGREVELGALVEGVDGETRVVCVHGIAGIGKSALLSAFLERARDGRVERHRARLPHRRADRARLPRTPPAGFDDVGELVRHLRGARAAGRARARPLRGVPAHGHLAAAGARAGAAGRRQPRARRAGAARSRAGSRSTDFRNLPLGPLEEADALLAARAARGARRARRAPEPDRARTSARAHARLRRRRRAPRARARGRGDDARGRGALAALPRGRRRSRSRGVRSRRRRVVRRVTEPRARRHARGARRRRGGAAAARRSRSSTPGRDGLVVHEAVRDAVAGFLRGTNPTRYRSYRRGAWRELRTEVARGGPGGALALHRGHALPDRQPGRARGVLPERQPAARRRAGARRRTAAAVSAIARRHEGPEAAAAARALVG